MRSGPKLWLAVAFAVAAALGIAIPGELKELLLGASDSTASTPAEQTPPVAAGAPDGTIERSDRRAGSTALPINQKARTFDDFRAAKRALYTVYDDHRDTLYCGCSYDTSRRKINTEQCGYQINEDRVRGNRIEAEHIVPASWIGKPRACWEQRDCRDDRGREVSGRACCLATDAEFRAAHNDLHNLAPTVGELNKHRSAAPFGMIDGEERRYGRCDFEVAHRRRVEPRPSVRGDIARVAFYMEQRHGVEIRAKQKRTLQRWAQADPVDEWERTRNIRIERVQGNRNPFVH